MGIATEITDDVRLTVHGLVHTSRVKRVRGSTTSRKCLRRPENVD